MKCLVINLDRSPGRLAHVAAEFARLGIEFERISAVDGANRSEWATPPLSPSEVACFLSHRVCWQIIADGEDSHGAIFEDDVVFAETAKALLVSADWVPARADIVKLETILWKTTIGIWRRNVGSGFSVARLCGAHHGTGGYLVSKKAARELLAATEVFRQSVDDHLFGHSHMVSGQRVYQLLPALCAQDCTLGASGVGLASDIDLDRRFGPDIRPAQTVIGREVRRMFRQMRDLCRGRWQKKVKFYYRGKMIVR